MRFTAFGHPNISATHKATLEFTKDTGLTAKGTCVVGIKAAYSLQDFKKLLDVIYGLTPIE